MTGRRVVVITGAGRGLGLASARRMAELMGGALGLEGKWLNGSAFWLELASPDAEARQDGPPLPLR